MNCIDFSTNKIMRPFGIAYRKNDPRTYKPYIDTMPKAKAKPTQKVMPPVGGVKLIPRMSPATANARNAVKTPSGRLMQFFR